MSAELREPAYRIVSRALDARGHRLGAVYGVAHFAERMALFALGVLALRDVGRPVVAAGALALLSVVRAWAQSAASGHAQALLHVRVGEALLERDLFRASALEDDDPEAALLDGVESGARIGANLVPGLFADIAGCIVVSIVLTQAVESSVLIAGGVGFVAAATLLALTRRITVREAERAWDGHRPVLDQLVAILSARLEIVANGADGFVRGDLQRKATDWRVRVARFERIAAIAGRLPLLLAAGLVVGVLFARSSSTHELALRALVLATAVPCFAGAALKLNELAKVGVRVKPLAMLLAPTAHSTTVANAVAAIAAPKAIALDGATYRYAGAKADVLRDATCTIERGAVTLLVGANGSGKSTLLRLMLGIEPPAAGTITVDGSGLADRGAALRAHVAYLPQRPYLSDRLSVRDAFKLLAPAVDDAAAMRWLDRVDIGRVLRSRSPEDPLATRVGQLSSGQKQRLALARIGVLERVVWFLDEPDASLDAEGLTRLEAILDEERSKRMVVVAAHADGLKRVADRVLRIEGGKLSDQPRPSGTFP